MTNPNWPDTPESVAGCHRNGWPDTPECAEKAVEKLPAQKRRIQADYKTAVYDYRKIEQLTPEVLRDGAVG